VALCRGRGIATKQNWPCLWCLAYLACLVGQCSLCPSLCAARAMLCSFRSVPNGLGGDHCRASHITNLLITRAPPSTNIAALHLAPRLHPLRTSPPLRLFTVTVAPDRPIFPLTAPVARPLSRFTVCFDFGPRRFTRIAPTTASASAFTSWSALHHRRVACARPQRHFTATIGSPFHPAGPAESPPSAIFTMSKRPRHERAATSPQRPHPNARRRAPP
jgi:hypothetical protein